MFFILKNISNSLAIDLGTSNTLVYRSNDGIVFNEPTYLALHSINQNVIEIGNAAKDMIGKNPENIKVIQPLKKGAISDLNATKIFLKHLTQKLITSRIKRPNIAVSIPFDLTKIERNSVIEALSDVGAKNIYLIEDPYSAAIGTNINIRKSVGNIILDIGGGVSEITLIASGGIVDSKSIRIGGDNIDKEIIDYLKRTKQILIGTKDAEIIKKEFGIGNQQNKSLTIKAKSTISRMPIITTIQAEDVQNSILPIFKDITQLVYKFISTIPVTFANEILDQGITITGGSSMLYGFDEFLKKSLKLDISYSKEPLLDIALGAGKIFEERNDILYKKFLAV